MQDASKQDGDQDRSLAAAWLGVNLEAGELERAKGGDQRDFNGIAAASNDHASDAGHGGGSQVTISRPSSRKASRVASAMIVNWGLTPSELGAAAPSAT